MKKIIVILVYSILYCTTVLNSQNNTVPAVTNPQKDLEDVVYLKTGAIVRGIIMEQIPNKSLEIKSNDNNYFVFKFDEIQKIAREKKLIDPTDYKKKGYINITEPGFGFGINTINTSHGSFDISKGDPIIGIRTINGYQLNEHYSFGLGIGFEAILDGTKKGALVPLTGDVRINFKKGKLSPTLNLNGGYSIGFQNSSGLTANPSIGLRLYLTKKIAFLANIGYKVQQQNVKRWDQYMVLVPRIVNFEYLMINTGLSF